MADFGYRITRDKGGKDSIPQTIDRSWNRKEAQQKMMEAVKNEVAKLKESGKEKEPMVLHDVNNDTVEIRHSADGVLIAFYEVEEFEQQ